MNILYEDNHLIAVEKRPGQLTQRDKSGKPALLEEVKAFIKERDQKPGNVFIGLLHRLDQPVGGVVLFAKTSKGAARISEQIREHVIKKTYEALVEGTPPPGGKIRQWLVKDKTTFKVRAYSHEVPNGLYAELAFRRLNEGDVSQVEIKPLTGRPHQIRVAMASLGTPIIGDKAYGATKPFNGHIALWATALEFNHPITQEPITIRSTPQEFVQ